MKLVYEVSPLSQDVVARGIEMGWPDRTALRRAAKSANSVRRVFCDRVIGSFDVAGRFEAPPASLQFVTVDAGDVPDLSSLETELLRMGKAVKYPVASNATADHRAGQCTSAIFTFTGEISPEASNFKSIAACHHSTVRQIGPLFSASAGARLLVTNSVVRDREVAGNSRVWLDEFYFDCDFAGLDFFARPEIRDALMNPGLGRPQGHLVRRWVGLDRS